MRRTRARYSISKYVGILGALLAFVVFELALIMSTSKLSAERRDYLSSLDNKERQKAVAVLNYALSQFSSGLKRAIDNDDFVESIEQSSAEVFLKGGFAARVGTNIDEVSFWIYNSSHTLVYSDGAAAAVEPELDFSQAFNGSSLSGAVRERGHLLWLLAIPVTSPSARDQVKGIVVAGMSLGEGLGAAINEATGLKVSFVTQEKAGAAAIGLSMFPGSASEGLAIVVAAPMPMKDAALTRLHLQGLLMALVTAILFGLFSAVATSLIVAKPIRRLLRRGRTRGSQRFSIEEFDLIASEIEGRGDQLDKEITLRGGVVRALSEGFQLVNERGVTLDVNPSLCQLVGLPKEQFLGRVDPFFYLDEEGRSRAADFIEMLRVDNCVMRMGFDCTIPNGSGGESCEVAIRMCLVSKDKLGHFTFAVLIVDRTFDRRQELRARRSDKAKIIGQMAAGVAHNINNLLTSMIGATSLLERVTAGNAAVPRLLSAIKESAAQGSLLTKELQQMALVNDGISLRTPIDASVAILDVVRIASGYPESAKIEFHTELPSGPVLALCEEGGLNQVLLNLVTNSIDAIDFDGGKIVVKAENVERQHGLVARISVSDNGNGIPSDVKAKLFEPFFSTKKRTSHNSKSSKSLIGGSGLGLSSAYGLVQSWGGEIEVESIVGKGSTFTVELPAARASSTSSDRLEVVEKLRNSMEAVSTPPKQ